VVSNDALQAANALSNLKLDDIAAIKANLHNRLESAKNEPAKPAEKPAEKLVNLPSSIQAEEQDEPLLMENKQRFVLFPIKYHEVLPPHSFHPGTCSRVDYFSIADLADVQEGRGIVLDRRGDRPVQGSP
jgi:hypothetical protein